MHSSSRQEWIVVNNEAKTLIPNIGPGWFLLEFSGGDRFVVVRCGYQETFSLDESDLLDGDYSENWELIMEDMNNGGYVNDSTDIIIAYLPIQAPISVTIRHS